MLEGPNLHVVQVDRQHHLAHIHGHRLLAPNILGEQPDVPANPVHQERRHGPGIFPRIQKEVKSGTPMVMPGFQSQFLRVKKKWGMMGKANQANQACSIQSRQKTLNSASDTGSSKLMKLEKSRSLRRPTSRKSSCLASTTSIASMRSEKKTISELANLFEQKRNCSIISHFNPREIRNRQGKILT